MRLTTLGLLAALCWLPASWAQAQETTQARSLAATCANCHGSDGRAMGEMKTLAGLPAATIVVAMNEFKDGRRPAMLMHQIAKGYSDEQIRSIAAYFAALKNNR